MNVRGQRSGPATEQLETVGTSPRTLQQHECLLSQAAEVWLFIDLKLRGELQLLYHVMLEFTVSSVLGGNYFDSHNNKSDLWMQSNQTTFRQRNYLLIRMIVFISVTKKNLRKHMRAFCSLSYTLNAKLFQNISGKVKWSEHVELHLSFWHTGSCVSAASWFRGVTNLPKQTYGLFLVSGWFPSQSSWDVCMGKNIWNYGQSVSTGAESYRLLLQLPLLLNKLQVIFEKSSFIVRK